MTWVFNTLPDVLELSYVSHVHWTDLSRILTSTTKIGVTKTKRCGTFSIKKTLIGVRIYTQITTLISQIIDDTRLTQGTFRYITLY